MPTKYYDLQVVPTDGPTLLTDTTREWLHDQSFEVVETTYMPFQGTKKERRYGYKFHITRQDVVDAHQNYGVEFNIEFVTQTIKQHFTDLAEDNFAIEDNLNLLTRGQ
jgi:hypothetical protein